MKDGHKEAHDELKLALAQLRGCRTHVRYAMNLHRMPDAQRECLAATLLKIHEAEKQLVRDFVKARTTAPIPQASKEAQP